MSHLPYIFNILLIYKRCGNHLQFFLEVNHLHLKYILKQERSLSLLRNIFE